MHYKTRRTFKQGQTSFLLCGQECRNILMFEANKYFKVRPIYPVYSAFFNELSNSKETHKVFNENQKCISERLFVLGFQRLL